MSTAHGGPGRVPTNHKADLTFLTRLQLPSTLTLAMRPSLSFPICKMEITLLTCRVQCVGVCTSHAAA